MKYESCTILKCQHGGDVFYSVTYGVHDSHTGYLLVLGNYKVKRFVKEWSRVAVVQLPDTMEAYEIWEWIQNDPEPISKFMDTEQYVDRIDELGSKLANDYDIEV